MLWRIEMIARTAEELMERSTKMHVSVATKIMREHSFDPYVIWGKDTGELLVEMMHQEVICPVGKLDGCVDTKTVLEWLGY